MKKYFFIIMVLCFMSITWSQEQNSEQKSAFQLGLVTPIGTNGNESSQFTNMFSLNLLGGYSYANTILEIGGIYNINQGYTKGMQLAGGFNLTFDSKNAWQIAGGANLALEGISFFQASLGGNIADTVAGGQFSIFTNLASEARGLQLSQFGNFSTTSVGAQLSGVNIAGNAIGLQLGWLLNIAGESFTGTQIGVGANILGEGAGLQVTVVENYAGIFDGLQVAGVINTTGKISGVQIAGIGNLTQSVSGPQIAGLGNLASEAKGLQLGGLGNLAVDIEGVQLSGIINLAKSTKGLQLGLINYAEQLDGVQIGLINIVKNGGKKEFELSYSDALDTVFSFKLGSDPFYSVFSGGANYFTDTLEYAYGLGFGTQLNWNHGWSNQIEIMAYQLTEDTQFANALNLLTQCKLLTSKQLIGILHIFAGPTVNMTISQYQDQDGNLGSSLRPWSIWETTNGNTHLNMWVGFNAGLSFRL